MFDSDMITIPFFMALSITVLIYSICFMIDWAEYRLWLMRRKRDLERFLDANRQIKYMPRKKVFSITLDEPDKKILETLAMRRKVSMKDIVGYYIQIDNEYDLYSGDWKARLDVVDSETKIIKALEDKCPGLIQLNETFVCLWGQDNAPPKIKKLTPFENQLEAACEGCTITKEIRNKIRDQESELRTLRAAVDVGIVGKIPQCKNGGRLKDDNKMWCPNTGTVKVKHCMTLRGGQPCGHLDMIAMSIKGELPDMKK